MRVVSITVSSAVIRGMLKAGEQLAEQHPGILELNLYDATCELNKTQLLALQEQIRRSDAVIVDLMGSPVSLVKAVYEVLEQTSGQVIPYGSSGRSYLRLGELTAGNMGRSDGEQQTSPSPEAMKRMAKMAETMGTILPVGKLRDMKNLAQLSKYLRNADEDQMLNLFYLLLREYGGQKQLPKPGPAVEIDEISLSHPAEKESYESVAAYWRGKHYQKNLPVVALLYYGHTYPSDTHEAVAQLIGEMEGFANVLPVAFTGHSEKTLKQLERWLTPETGCQVQLILNLMSFRLGAGPMGGDGPGGVSLLEAIGVPYFHPFFMSRREVGEWQASAQGINASEFLVSVMLPELDGCLETIPIGAMSQVLPQETHAIEVKKLVLIPERVERLVERIKAHLRLAAKPNQEKRIAVIGYNYPPGEGNLLGGAFLDTFRSIEQILFALRHAGYQVTPYEAGQLEGLFQEKKIVNSSPYADFSTEIPVYEAPSCQRDLAFSTQELKAHWGEAPGKIMVNEAGDYLIPGLINGNVFIGLQPTRGFHEEPEKLYHDQTLPPHHQYIAFYQWIKSVFQADVLVHIGTHGTFEFLAGKECGLSGTCYPDKLLGHLPHLYLYYVGNPAEAMIAKRRSYANLVSYQPPVFEPGELYGSYAALADLIDQYHQARRAAPGRAAGLMEKIGKLAQEAQLPKELDLLEKELYRMNRSLIPKGLHVFGQAYGEQEAKAYVKGLLRYDRGSLKSLQRLAAESVGLDYDQFLKTPNGRQQALIDERAEALFEAHWQEPSADPTFQFAREQVKKVLVNEEMEGLIRVLEGGYRPAKLAGDLYRSPEVLPTGYNLYQFDPRQVPSAMAYDRGVQAAARTLELYHQDKQALPASVAVILWGLETSRTQGETMGQILAYWGVKPVYGKNQWEIQYEIIPAEVLGRPRIDTVITICGFFRDLFPNLLEVLNQVLEQLCQVEEPDEINPIRANTRLRYHQLLDQGYGHEEAWELAMARIFGPEEAGYGTKLGNLVETKCWEQESQLGEAFTAGLRHVYTKHFRGKTIKGLYEQNLKQVELISQIRSNHEYEITDLDHYYEFFGGLSKSVETLRGEKVARYITDTTGEGVEAEPIEGAVGRGLRTRLLNPKWIDSLLAHSSHGGQQIAKRFENVLGLAATAGGVQPWMYEGMYRTYMEDLRRRDQMKENNPHAYLSMVEHMLEYHQRGYWQAEEAQLDTLRQLYLELEGEIESEEKGKDVTS